MDVDIAIVGAGVSGVYSAWRLLTDTDKTVQVFEASGRIGGRLLSVTAPGIPHVACELGGMRYMSTQERVKALVEKELKLGTHPLAVYEPENLNYLRGQRFRNSELAAGVNVPYNLSWSERGVRVDALLTNVLDQIIPGVTKLSGDALRETLATYKVDGRSLFDWGFWNLIARGMTHEAYELARVTSGYDTPMGNWNAYDTISLNFDFTPDVTFHGFDKGFQTVPLTIAERVEQAGGKIHLHHRLESFETAADGAVTLRLSTPDGPRTVTAGKLILAMPRRSLELIDAPLLRDPDVARLIATVTPIPLFKIFVAYDYPWWESLGLTTGRTVTDLPIRQVYYWGKAAAHGPDPDNCKAVLLASYDDGLSVDYWAGLTRPNPGHHPFEPRHDRDTERHPGSQSWHDCKANRALVEEVDRQLREIHDVRYAPKPYAAAFMDWGCDPFGGGVNFWNVHARSPEVIPRMTQPSPAHPVYVCGEAYSNGQGWVEGALETAELVLQNHLGLKPPAWL